MRFFSSHRIAASKIKPGVSYHVSDYQEIRYWKAALVNGYTSKRIGEPRTLQTLEEAIAFCEKYEETEMANDPFNSETGKV